MKFPEKYGRLHDRFSTIVMSVWNELGSFGIFGGYLAAGIIIGPMWFYESVT